MTQTRSAGLIAKERGHFFSIYACLRVKNPATVKFAMGALLNYLS